MREICPACHREQRIRVNGRFVVHKQQRPADMPGHLAPRNCPGGNLRPDQAARMVEEVRHG